MKDGFVGSKLFRKRNSFHKTPWSIILSNWKSCYTTTPHLCNDPDGVPLVSHLDVADEIGNNSNEKIIRIVLWLDLITLENHKTIQGKALVKLTTLINDFIRLDIVPDAS